MGILSYLFAMTYDSMLAPVEASSLGALRASLLASASGAVLEVGAGTGVNVAHYQQLLADAAAGGKRPPLRRLVLVEPAAPMRSRLTARVDAAVAAEAAAGVAPAARLPAPDVVAASLPALPFPDASFDTVVLFLVLCSVGQADALDAAVADVRRLLAPGGRVLLLEHVAAVDGTPVAAQQARWNGLWGLATGGCSLCQETEAALRRGGFDTSAVEYQTLVEGGMGALPFARVALGVVSLRDGGAGDGEGGGKAAAEGVAAVVGPP